MNIWELIVVQPMTNILLLITMLVKNFGVAIILFTILIKLVTMPFTIKQVKSRRKMAELQSSPEYKKVMAKYKDDREKLAMEQQRLYKESGVSPLAHVYHCCSKCPSFSVFTNRLCARWPAHQSSCSNSNASSILSWISTKLYLSRTVSYGWTWVNPNV